MIPENAQAELSVLSVMMMQESGSAQCIAELEPEDFFDGRNRKIFQLAQEIAAEGKPVDLVSLTSVYPDGAYLVDIAQVFASPAQTPGYIQELKEARKRRELIAICKAVIQSAEDNEPGYLEAARQGVETVAAIGGADVAPVGLEAVDAVTAIGERKMGIRTGFGRLDNALFGMKPGELIIVGARPSMGKTSFAMNIAVYVAHFIGPVAVFSLEMSKEPLLQRAAYSMSGVSRQDIIAGDEKAAEKLMQAALDLSGYPLYMDDRGGVGVAQIRSTCYKVKRKAKGLSLVIVDYLGLVRPSGRKNGNREQEVAEISRSMKLMAKELECPVLLMAQLNRGVEGREDKSPRLSDLRESGAIEQDADAVIFLHRPAVYDDTKDPGEAWALLRKNRNGPTGEIALRWSGEHYRFTSTDWTHDADAAPEQMRMEG